MVLVDTSAFVVLVATDPMVAGYSSGLATIYYRIDPSSSSSAFSVYTSSVPLPLGFHFFQYRSVDYAGNFESIRTSTFLITAGNILNTSGNLVSTGSLLNGFIDSGARFEAQSRAENSYTLLISSADSARMLNVNNIGNVVIGSQDGAAWLDVNQELGLRSGNANTSTTSVQVAFGKDGGTAERHALVTRHHSSTIGNSLDFYVWNNLAPSTSALAAMDLLAIQASTNASGGVVHVRPTGDPGLGVELIVSNGATIGGGSIMRAGFVSSSSDKMKTDVSRLSRRNQTSAWQDVTTLKHARFAYHGEPLNAPLRRGLIYEDAPDSIKGPGRTLGMGARLTNVELAIKEAAERLQSMKERLEALEQR